MNLLDGFLPSMGSVLSTAFWFVVVFSVLVFVHEFGHYWIARRNGVRVEVFSIGFGPELFGWSDRAGTRWKVSAVPLGGYVRMFGQSDLGPDDQEAAALPPEEKAVSFAHKRLGQKAAIVAAGPAANLLFAILVFAVLFSTIGQQFTTAAVTSVQPDSPAAAAGIQPDDLIVAVDGRSTQRFEEVQQLVRLNPGIEIEVVVERNGERLPLRVVPEAREVSDNFGNQHRIGVLGVLGTEQESIRHDPLTATWQAVRETTRLVGVTFTALGQIVTGDRGTEDLGGPLRIAKLSGDVATTGLIGLVQFAAFLSINLGLLNLFPIPVLDGGHLVFYAYEAVRGRPMTLRAQEYGFRIGLALVFSLMVFATWNDLVQLRVVEFLVGLGS